MVVGSAVVGGVVCAVDAAVAAAVVEVVDVG